MTASAVRWKTEDFGSKDCSLVAVTFDQRVLLLEYLLTLVSVLLVVQSQAGVMKFFERRL